MEYRRAQQRAQCQGARAACGLLDELAAREPVLWAAAVMASRVRVRLLPQFDEHGILQRPDLLDALRCLLDDEFERTLSRLAADLCLAWRRLCSIAESPGWVESDLLALYPWLEGEQDSSAAATSSEIRDFLVFVRTQRVVGRLLRIALSIKRVRPWQATGAPLMGVRDALAAVQLLERDELDDIPRRVPPLLEALRCTLSKGIMIQGGHDTFVVAAAFLAVRAIDQGVDQRILDALRQWPVPPMPRLHVSRSEFHVGQVGSTRSIKKSLQEWLEAVAPPLGADPDVTRDAKALGIMQRHQMK